MGTNGGEPHVTRERNAGSDQQRRAGAHAGGDATYSKLRGMPAALLGELPASKRPKGGPEDPPAIQASLFSSFQPERCRSYRNPSQVSKLFSRDVGYGAFL